MKYIEVIADQDSYKTVQAIAEKAKARDFRATPVDDDGMQQSRMLVHDEYLQTAVDTLQTVLGAQPTARIVVMPVEIYLPRPNDENGQKKDKKSKSDTRAREALYEHVEKSSRPDRNYFVLVVLSTIVAAIGMIEGNTAVVIGAMVIAPLLGPNLGLSLATALGDTRLMGEAVLTLFLGIIVALGMSAALGYFWPEPFTSEEVLSRTTAGLDSVALALASGAAAALSLTTGLSSAVVGVMVAVALLPPATSAGLMLGKGNFTLAWGALLLLIINIVCVNLASKVVFYFKNIRPRTWFEKKKAQRAMRIVSVAWLISLSILILIIVMRGKHTVVNQSEPVATEKVSVLVVSPSSSYT